MRLVRIHPDPARALKFRQAAIGYLFYGFLYWFGVYALLEAGLFPETRGPAVVWLGLGALIALVIVSLLWWWHSPWLARALVFVMALRLPGLMEGAFLEGAHGVAPGFYLAGGIVVLIVMWMVARAGWDV